jgi:molybdopterin converting factor subunit 1
VRVKIRFFALHRQRLGRREEELDLPEGATVAAAWRELVAAHPELDGSGEFVRFARNGAYVEPGEVLVDADELAIIPPVAGGDRDPASGPLVRELTVTPAPIDEGVLARLAAAVASPLDGAVVTFVGRTRETPGTPAPGQEAEAARFRDRAVVALEYEAYESMALSVLGRIAGEIEERFAVRRLAIVHRTGRVEMGEPSVAIVVAAPHRAEAFDACRYAIEELKARAPIWKSEQFSDGSVWLGQPARAGAAVAAGGEDPAVYPGQKREET